MRNIFKLQQKFKTSFAELNYIKDIHSVDVDILQVVKQNQQYISTEIKKQLGKNFKLNRYQGLQYYFSFEGSDYSYLQYNSIKQYSTQPPRKGFGKFYQHEVERPNSDKQQHNKLNNQQDGNEQEKNNNNGSKDQGSQKFEENIMNQIMTVLFISFMVLRQYQQGEKKKQQGEQPPQETDFQFFRNELLSKGQVERLVVVNSQMVKVYIKNTQGIIANISQITEEQTNSSLDPNTFQEDFQDYNNFQKESQHEDQIKVDLKNPSRYAYYFKIGSIQSFEEKLEEVQKEMGVSKENFVAVKYSNEVSLSGVIGGFLPILLTMGALYFFMGRGMGGMSAGGPGGGGAQRNMFNVGKARIATIDKNNSITFKDVAGCDEAKNEVMEFVHFLKNPEKYRKLGARIPKGALLNGPPGTGKTMLAKATATEAGVPFLSMSGSDFMEMFVGVGPARVRDLFAQARQNQPSIIFIDEIDAIGRQRSRGGFAGGGSDEKEQTLNQLLIEMDGFKSSQNVVVLAGTNRSDILDSALMRPGRFDRTITIDSPDVKGREQIFNVHLKKLKLTDDIAQVAKHMAAMTPGFVGADIANVCNESALVAARNNKQSVGNDEFNYAIDRVVGGIEKKNRKISKEERRTVAYHESGHAVVGWFLEHSEPLLKVSIVPRGTATLGFAMHLPNENLLKSSQQLEDMICMTLGGRASEEVFFGDVTTGAQNDLEKVTQLAYTCVQNLGMNSKVGLLSFPLQDPQQRYFRPYSDYLQNLIDNEANTMIENCYNKTLDIIRSKKGLIEQMAQQLLSKEVLQQDEIIQILGQRPFKFEEERNIDQVLKNVEPAT